MGIYNNKVSFVCSKYSPFFCILQTPKYLSKGVRTIKTRITGYARRGRLVVQDDMENMRILL